MKKFRLPLIMLLTLIVLQACGGSSLDKLNGTWVCDTQATLDMLPDGKSMSAMEREMFAKMMASVNITFNTAEKTIKMELGFLNTSRPFTVTSDSGNKLELLAEGKDKLFIEVKDAKTLIFSDPNEKDMRLVLKKKG